MARSFQGLNLDPEGGLPLRQALSFYATKPPVIDANKQNVGDIYEQLAFRQSVQRSGYHGADLSDDDAFMLKNLERLFLEVLTQRLSTGMLRARGFVAASLNLADISTIWWQRGGVRSGRKYGREQRDESQRGANFRGFTITCRRRADLRNWRTRQANQQASVASRDDGTARTRRDSGQYYGRSQAFGVLAQSHASERSTSHCRNDREWYPRPIQQSQETRKNTPEKIILGEYWRAISGVCSQSDCSWRFMENRSDARQIMQILVENEAAAYLGLSARTLQRYRHEGGGPKFTRLSQRRLGYAQADLDAWLAERKFPSRAAELAQQIAA